MKEVKIKKDFEDALARLGDKYWGKYLLNRFFIQIKTRKRRIDIPSYNFEEDNFSVEDQLKLQKENFPAIFHEYIHYIHEVSTMAGTTNFYYQFVNRAYFSMSAVNTKGSEFPTIDVDTLKMMKRTNSVFASLDGGNLHNIESIFILRIIDIQLNDFYAQLPNLGLPLKMKIPVINFEAFDKETEKYTNEELYLGKFYLYEGIAHNIDRLIQLEMGFTPVPASKISAEYLVMEKVAKHIVSDLNLREMLELATLSLSYLNCGEYFIGFLNEIAKSNNRDQTLNELKEETKFLLQERFMDFKETFEDLKGALKGRRTILNAVDYLSNLMIAGMSHRINNPVFEIDVVYSKRYSEIQKYVDMCPMMYEFDEDFDTFKRDYTGINSYDHGDDMLTLLGYLDYYYSAMAKIEIHCCPLYTSCNHPLRKAKGDQCKSKPRLAYEDNIEFGWCHYGLGVAYHKHIDEDVNIAN